MDFFFCERRESCLSWTNYVLLSSHHQNHPIRVAKEYWNCSTDVGIQRWRFNTWIEMLRGNELIKGLHYIDWLMWEQCLMFLMLENEESNIIITPDIRQICFRQAKFYAVFRVNEQNASLTLYYTYRVLQNEQSSITRKILWHQPNKEEALLRHE